MSDDEDEYSSIHDNMLAEFDDMCKDQFVYVQKENAPIELIDDDEDMDENATGVDIGNESLGGIFSKDQQAFDKEIDDIHGGLLAIKPIIPKRVGIEDKEGNDRIFHSPSFICCQIDKKLFLY